MKKDLDKDDAEKGKVIISFDYKDKTYVDRDSNLQIADLTTEQVRVYLNRAPAKYAYYGSLLSKVKREFRNLNDEFDFWKAEAYDKIEGIYVKKTETFKKNQIILANPKKYKLYKTQLSDLQYVMDQLEVLTKSYEMQSRTLQTVGSLLKAEMELS